jgi:hypothetical protein
VKFGAVGFLAAAFPLMMGMAASSMMNAGKSGLIEMTEPPLVLPMRRASVFYLFRETLILWRASSFF